MVVNPAYAAAPERKSAVGRREPLGWATIDRAGMRETSSAGAVNSSERSLSAVALERPLLRPSPRPWRPPRLTAGFALGYVLTLGVLGAVSAVWLVGMVATAVLLLVGHGTLGPFLAFAITGALLLRGWVGMVQTIRGRLRTPDLEEPAALPAEFWSLSRGLQRLVRHTRSLQIVVEDRELSLAQLDRELFEWTGAMAELDPVDQRWLEERGVLPAMLRAELVASRWSTDAATRQHLLGLLGRRPLVPMPRVEHRERASLILERVLAMMLQTGGDPFRGRVGQTSA